MNPAVVKRVCANRKPAGQAQWGKSSPPVWLLRRIPLQLPYCTQPLQQRLPRCRKVLAHQLAAQRGARSFGPKIGLERGTIALRAAHGGPPMCWWCGLELRQGCHRGWSQQFPTPSQQWTSRLRRKRMQCWRVACPLFPNCMQRGWGIRQVGTRWLFLR